MRVSLVDPSAYTPPYDRALAAALVRAGAEVELLTSRFLYGPVPDADGYRVRELFYRRAAARGLHAPARRALKIAEHLPDMLRLREAVAGADLVHHQWLTLPALDPSLLPADRAQPRVMTAHYILPANPGRARLLSARRAFGAMDAVIAHSELGAAPAPRAGRARPGPGPGHPARGVRLPHPAVRSGAPSAPSCGGSRGR